MILSFTALSSARAESGIVAPEGPPRAYVAADQLLREHGSRFTLEEWTYTVDLAGGGAIFLTLAYSNLWFLPPSVALEASIVLPGREPVLFGHREGKDGVKQDPEAPRVELAPTLWMEGLPSGAHRLHVESAWHGGLVLDLALSRGWPGFVIGDGIFRVGDDPDARVQAMVATPRAKVTGTLRMGDTGAALTGWAVVEHTFYGRLAAQLFERRQTVQARLSGRSVVAVLWKAQVAYGGDSGGFIALAGPDGVQRAATNPTVLWPETRSVRGCAEPARFLLQAGQDPTMRIAGKATARLQAFGLTDSMRPITRAAVNAVVGNPMFVRSRSRIELDPGKGKRQSGHAIQRVECARGD